MSNGDYRNHPALNYSHLKLMYKPALYKKMVLEGSKKPASHAMSIGTAVHLCMLEPHLMVNVVNLKNLGFTTRRKHLQIKELIDANPGKVYLLNQEIAQVNAMVKSVKGHEEAAKLYPSTIKNEVSFFWHDKEFNLACKGRADSINFEEGYVNDLKTCKDAANFMRECVDYGYHIQAAFYLAGLKEITGVDFDWYWTVVDSKDPHDTYVYKMTAKTLEAGNVMVRKYMMALVDCVKTDTWPSGNEGVKLGELPDWYLSRVLKKEEGSYNEFRAT
jgi:hypothetical protein